MDRGKLISSAAAAVSADANAGCAREMTTTQRHNSFVVVVVVVVTANCTCMMDLVGKGESDREKGESMTSEEERKSEGHDEWKKPS